MKGKPDEKESTPQIDVYDVDSDPYDLYHFFTHGSSTAHIVRAITTMMTNGKGVKPNFPWDVVTVVFDFITRSNDPRGDLMKLFSSRPDSWSLSADVVKWKGIKLTPASDFVIINTGTSVVGGQIDFARLPNGLSEITVVNDHTGLTGMCDTSRLPQYLRTLRLSNHALNGYVHLTRLPNYLTVLDLSKNKLRGNVNLSRLPSSSLQELNLSNNKFGGPVQIGGSLPCSLTSLNLEDNHLSGTFAFTALPSGLRTLKLKSNDFNGEVPWDQLPRCLETFDISFNEFCGHVSLAQLPNDLEYLTASGNRFTGTVSLLSLPNSLLELRLSTNQLGGNVSLSNLPPNLRVLALNDNTPGINVNTGDIEKYVTPRGSALKMYCAAMIAPPEDTSISHGARRMMTLLAEVDKKFASI